MRHDVTKKYLDKYSLGVVDVDNSLEQYNSFFRNMGFKESIEDIIRQRLNEKAEDTVRQKIKGKVFVKVMDIGCGNAGFLNDLKKIFDVGIRTIGVDLLAPVNQPDEMVVGDALEVPFPKEIDFIFSFRSLHEIGEPGKIVEKVYASLAKGGKAFLSFRTTDLYLGDKGIGEIGEKEVKALQKIVRSRRLAGFKVQGFEVMVKDDNGKKHTAGVNVFLEK